MDVTIARCEPCHLAAMRRLYNSSFDHPWTLDQLSIYADTHHGCEKAWGAFCKGHLVGFIAVLDGEQELDLVTLCVQRGSRRCGIAKALLHYILSTNRCCTLEVNEHNHGAKALYAALGFLPVGRRPRYYRRAGGNYDDAIIYQRDLYHTTLEHIASKTTAL